MSTTTLLTLPFLVLISIPLAITACITICFSVIALLLQLAAISIELCYALVTNIFTLPQSSSWTLLSFTASQPATPLRRRSSDYGLNPSSSYYPLATPPAFRAHNRPSLGRRCSSGLPLEDGDEESPTSLNSEARHAARRPSFRRHAAYAPPVSGFLGLINGEEDRDFEGLGGWRCPPSSSKTLAYRSGHTSPSPAHSVSDELDDLAWVSINSRLELPSQPLTRRSLNDITEPYMPIRQATISDTRTHPRHHRRSSTSPMISGLGIRAPSSTNLEPNNGQPTEVISPSSSYNNNNSNNNHNSSAAVHWDRTLAVGGGPNTFYNHNIPQDGSGGYFALQPSFQSGSGARTTSNTTPNEERKPMRSVGGFMHHSPASPRNRRQSVSGSNPRPIVANNIWPGRAS